MMPHRHAVILLLVTLLGVPGCVQQAKEKSLQRVAKDWCMTIRASQVIPVYPLTEDLQPGDVFLVQTPIQRQETLYKEKGFLPLDQMVTRLHDLDYRSFYRQGDYEGVPHARPAPAQPSMHAPLTQRPNKTGENPEGSTPNVEAQQRRFSGAPLPMAAFPSYSFDVNRSFGMQVAVPVQGVPVGLGLMQTDRAIGTITIADGLTYGIDSEHAMRRLRIWADQPVVRQELSDFASLVPGDLYLRVLTRVYFAGAMNVVLQDARAGGGGIDAGQTQPIQFPNLTGKDPEPGQADHRCLQGGAGPTLRGVDLRGPRRFGSHRFRQ